MHAMRRIAVDSNISCRNEKENRAESTLFWGLLCFWVKELINNTSEYGADYRRQPK